MCSFLKLINAVVLLILLTALSDPEQYHLTSAELANDLDVMDDASKCPRRPVRYSKCPVRSLTVPLSAELFYIFTVFVTYHYISSGKQLVCILFYLKLNLLQLTVTDDLISARGVTGSAGVVS